MNELYRTYEVLVEETVPADYEKRLKGKTDKPLRWNAETDGALRDTHMIFQDAVCYYTLCLAGLAGNEKHKDGTMAGKPLNPLYGHLTGALKQQTEAVIRRLAANYRPLASISTTEAFFQRAYSWPGKPDDLKPLLPAAYGLLESYGMDYAEQDGKPTNVPKECKPIKNFRNDHFGRLHDPVSGKADTSRDKAVENYFAKEKSRLAPDENVPNERTLAESLDLRFCFKSPKSEVTGLLALYDYLAAFGIRNPQKTPSTIGKLQPSAGESESDRKKFAEYYDCIRQTRSRLLEEYGEYPSVEKDASQEQKKETRTKQQVWIKNAELKAQTFAWKSHAGKKPNKRLWYCLRYKFCAHASVRLALYEEIKKLEPQAVDTSKPDAFNQWRQLIGKGKAPIPAFTSLLGEGCVDPEFDKSAFAAAAEDLFKYKIRTRAREEKVRKVLKIVQAHEAKGEQFLDADDSPMGKKVTIYGMEGDPRWKAEDDEKAGIESLLKELRGEKKLDEYGLRDGTIGGWPEVRKALLQVHKVAAKESWERTKLSKQLEIEVDKEMESNRQGFGSADFFHALCDPAYHHLWLNASEQDRAGIKDFIPHYVRYAEWREELIDLLIDEEGNAIEQAQDLTTPEIEKLSKKPISYTWPGLLNRHKKPSYRYFDFTAPLKANLQLKSLFRRVVDAHGGIPAYKKLIGDDAKLTLAARRLKRDKIMKADGSVDALWCPPLVLEGVANPTTTDKPRAGKYDDPKEKTWPRKDIEASFSLMAKPLPGDEWNKVAGVPSSAEKQSVHLTVSIPIEGDELAKLHSEGVHFIGGSLKGVDENDDKRKFFRWPVDIETDKFASKEAVEHARKGEGKPKKQSKKQDVKSEDLWCHFNGGFRAKESRYSKAEKTKVVPDFHILSVDLGNRFAAGFSRQRIHAAANGTGRVISAESFKPIIKAEVTRTGTLRLQGEDAKIWQHAMNTEGHCLKDAQDNYIYEFKKEPYGNDGRGRFPDEAEYEKFKTLATRLVDVKSLSFEGTEKMTYPELGDHLVFRLKRRIGRLRTLFNLLWRVCGDKERDKKGKYTIPRDPSLRDFHQRMVVEALARSAFPKRERQPGEAEDKDDENLRLALAAPEQWKQIKDSKLLESTKGIEEKSRRAELEKAIKNTLNWKWGEFPKAVKAQITDYCAGSNSIDKLLAGVLEFCLPLRGRHWRWSRETVSPKQRNGERLHMGSDGEDKYHGPKILGMRGLSMKRLEQLLNLRQRCQSFAKLEDRFYDQFRKNNFNPPDSAPRDEVDDICPLLLDRSNRLREQRVYQTAHLILAEALGMKLKNPAEVNNKKARRLEVDLHGEYERRKDKAGDIYPRCSVIVLENLTRYKTSQERTRTENSRLMKWAHRAIVEKLEDMCKPFGITIMLVDPAFSSRFDSFTGLPGVRVNSVSRDFEKHYPYNKWINDKTKKGDDTQLARDIKSLVRLFESNQQYKDTLLLAVEGGKEFLPVSGSNKDIQNADINAAVNIGLRAVADPRRLDIFPRLRTKQLTEGKVQVLNWRGVFGQFGKDDEKRRLVASPLLKAAAQGDAPVPDAGKKTKKQKKGQEQTNPTGPDNDSESSTQSSEFPPFFVQAVEFEGMPQDEAFESESSELPAIRAFSQGLFLKRVECLCNERIRQINLDRVRK